MKAQHYIYRNLQTGTFSQRYKGLVIAHPGNILLKDVTFNVSDKGRQRVLTEKRKNVHATIAGTPTDFPIGYKYASEVYYDPYKVSQFTRKSTGKPVLTAKYVLCSHNKIFILEQ